MRAADNSQYGEFAATVVVVPLNANTPAGAVYDTTGMKLETDSTGNYLVQDQSMLATPSKALQDLITQNTGGASSPYSWGRQPVRRQRRRLIRMGRSRQTLIRGIILRDLVSMDVDSHLTTLLQASGHCREMHLVL